MARTPSNPSFSTARFLDRPRIRDGNSEAEAAIFAATEAMLAEKPLGDFSVSQIIEAAGISRATFYHYFSSKLGIVSGLLARTMDELFEIASPFLFHDGGSTIEESIRLSIGEAIELWVAHRILLRTVMEHWAADVELEAQWVEAMSRFADAVAAEIDVARKQKLLPAGLPSRELATTLIWSTERCLYIAGRGIDPALPDERGALNALTALWVNTLTTETAPTRRTRKR